MIAMCVTMSMICLLSGSYLIMDAEESCIAITKAATDAAKMAASKEQPKLVAVDCVGAWGAKVGSPPKWSATSWGSCSKNCGGGTREQVYKVTTEAKNGGKACPVKDGAVGVPQPCNTNDCAKPQDCKVESSAWAACVADEATRRPTMKTDCVSDSGKFSDNKATSLKVDTIVTPPRNGGKACQSTSAGGTKKDWVGDQVKDKFTTIYRDCTLSDLQKTCAQQNKNKNECIDLCNVDCKGGWNAWSSCPSDCLKKGEQAKQQTKKYAVTVFKLNNGTACSDDHDQTSTRKCKQPNCWVDCLGKWTDPTKCSTDCIKKGGAADTADSFYVVSTPRKVRAHWPSNCTDCSTALQLK